MTRPITVGLAILVAVSAILLFEWKKQVGALSTSTQPERSVEKVAESPASTKAGERIPDANLKLAPRKLSSLSIGETMCISDLFAFPDPAGRLWLLNWETASIYPCADDPYSMGRSPIMLTKKGTPQNWYYSARMRGVVLDQPAKDFDKRNFVQVKEVRP